MNEISRVSWDPRRLQVAMRAALAGVAVLVPCAIVFRWDRIGHLHDPRWQILLTLVGLAAGAWLASIQARASGRFRKTALVSIVTIALSQVCYLVLVWTSFVEHPSVWRVWWLTLVAAVTSTHVVWLRLTAAPDRRKLMRCTVGCALVAAGLWEAVALRRELLGNVSDWYLGAIVLFALASAIGSLALWLRGLKLANLRVPKPVRVGWIIASQVALVGVAFYAGRVTAPPGELFDRSSSALAHLEPSELDRQVRSDLERLKVVAKGMDELDTKLEAEAREFLAKRNAEGRDYFTPTEEDAIRGQFMSFLAYRSALLRVVATYAGFSAVPDPEARARCMLLGYAAGSLVYDKSLKLVTLYRDDELVRRKLNEADPKWGIPAGMFDRIYENVAQDRNAEALGEMAAYFQQNREAWGKRKVFDSAKFAWVAERIDRSAAEIKGRRFDRSDARWEQLVSRVRRDTYDPIYSTQTVVSTLIGDTRLIQWEPLIRKEQIREMRGKLRPGDILLERRNWFLSNAFLPGFWPHSAIYVGTVEELEKIGLVRKDEKGQWTSDEPDVRGHLAEYLSAAHDGETRTVLESISEGVVFNSLTESMHADYVAVLRPRLSEAQKAQAIARAFSHVGKPYDFEFDFFSADKLVCTELVYRAYYGMVDFPLVKIMGTNTLPALEIARKYAAERGSEGRQLDFVMFLDGVPGERCAKMADEGTFCGSIDRPRGFNE
jgi:hypothetical protein